MRLSTLQLCDEEVRQEWFFPKREREAELEVTSARENSRLPPHSLFVLLGRGARKEGKVYKITRRRYRRVSFSSSLSLNAKRVFKKADRRD